MNTPLSSCDLGSVVGLDRVVHPSLGPVYPGCPPVTGPAYTVAIEADDNLGFHRAIHRAPPGSVIVAVTQGSRAAVAGGRVCAVAQRRGIAGFVIDGFLRDAAEIEALGFPVYARGLCPVPGTKTRLGRLGDEVTCGGVVVRPGDLVVADRDGVVVVAAEAVTRVEAEARRRVTQDLALTLDQWEAQHREKTEALERSLEPARDPK